MKARRIAAAVCLASFLLLSVAFVLAPERVILTRIEIAAPPARVWAALTDAAKYPEWNPDLRLIGRLAAGEIIEVHSGRDADEQVFHSVVLVARPGAEIRWSGHVWFPRVFDVVHDFQFETDVGGTRLTQSERLRGIALWLFDLRPLVRHFDLVDAELKKRAEMASK